MQFTGTRSWRFEQDIERVPHFMLFVRDALHLETSAADDLPPSLTVPLPDRQGSMPRSVRAAAAEQWPTWWRTSFPTPEEIPVADLSNVPDAGIRRAMRLQQLLDPPEWPSLADFPELQGAVAALNVDAERFATEVRQSHIRPPRPLSVFTGDVLRRAAKATATRRGVDVGSLSARATILAVQGPWWHVTGACSIVCSVDLAAHPDAAFEAAAAAFSSAV